MGKKSAQKHWVFSLLTEEQGKSLVAYLHKIGLWLLGASWISGPYSLAYWLYKASTLSWVVERPGLRETAWVLGICSVLLGCVLSLVYVRILDGRDEVFTPGLEYTSLWRHGIVGGVVIVAWRAFFDLWGEPGLISLMFIAVLGVGVIYHTAFFAWAWSLTYQDVEAPESDFQKEVVRLRARVHELENRVPMVLQTPDHRHNQFFELPGTPEQITQWTFDVWKTGGNVSLDTHAGPGRTFPSVDKYKEFLEVVGEKKILSRNPGKGTKWRITPEGLVSIETFLVAAGMIKEREQRYQEGVPMVGRG